MVSKIVDEWQTPCRRRIRNRSWSSWVIYFRLLWSQRSWLHSGDTQVIKRQTLYTSWSKKLIAVMPLAKSPEEARLSPHKQQKQQSTGWIVLLSSWPFHELDQFTAFSIIIVELIEAITHRHHDHVSQHIVSMSVHKLHHSSLSASFPTYVAPPDTDTRN